MSCLVILSRFSRVAADRYENALNDLVPWAPVYFPCPYPVHPVGGPEYEPALMFIHAYGGDTGGLIPATVPTFAILVCSYNELAYTAIDLATSCVAAMLSV